MTTGSNQQPNMENSSAGTLLSNFLHWAAEEIKPGLQAPPLSRCPIYLKKFQSVSPNIPPHVVPNVDLAL